MKKLITLFALLLCISVTAQSTELNELDTQRNNIIESTVNDLKNTDTILKNLITLGDIRLKEELLDSIKYLTINNPQKTFSNKIYYKRVSDVNYTVLEDDIRNMTPFIIDKELKNVTITLPNLELEPYEIVYFNYKFESDEQANSLYTIDGKTWEVWKKVNFTPTTNTITIKK